MPQGTRRAGLSSQNKWRVFFARLAVRNPEARSSQQCGCCGLFSCALQRQITMSSFEIQYNGVRLLGITTLTCNQAPAMDESNTDPMYSKVEIAGKTVINAAVLIAQNQHLGVIGNGVTGATAQEVCKALQPILGANRGAFKYIQNGVVQYEADGKTDCNNGPRVRFELKPMGRSAIAITFHIEIAVADCSNGLPVVLNNRWQVSDDVDDQSRTTRIWRGKLRLSNVAHNVHAFRHLLVPRLSDGFRRMYMKFHGELNGLEISYEISDRQLLGDAAPYPAVRMSGTHTESLSQDGATSIGQIHVRLDGTPGTDKLDLLQRAMQIVSSKVQADRFRTMTGWRWLELVITDHLGEDVCAVEIIAKVQRAIETKDGTGASLKLGNMILDTLGRPLDLGGDYVRYRTVPPDLYPCTTVGLFICHLQTPCNDNHGMPQGALAVDSEGDKPGQEEAETTQVTYDPSGPQLDIEPPGLSQDHVAAMYTHARANWGYDIDEGIVPMAYGDKLPGESKDSMAFIRLHQPVASVTVVVAVERIGEFPKVPKKKRFTDKNGITYVPLKYRLTTQPIEYQGDGRKLHIADLTMVLGMSRAPEEGEYIIPTLPWDDQEESTVPTVAFSDKQ